MSKRLDPPRTVVLLLAAAVAAAGPPRPEADPDRDERGAPPFTEAAAGVGLDFHHFNGMGGEWTMVEHMGPGVGLFDYDNDGDLDLYAVQGAMLGTGKTLAQATFPPKGPLPPRHRLFRNDLVVGPEGRRTLRFTDVTEASGIDVRGYGMGVAAGDFDNDGWVDLYVTNFGSNHLLRNDGDGTFTDVTRAAGVDDPRWSTSAAFLDYDRDGRLDLFVCNYLQYTLAGNRKCSGLSGARDYCSPQMYPAAPSRLFRNRGSGSFEDVTVKSGIARTFGPALGVVAGDFDRDGFIDLYVANDGTPNLLWMNQRDGTFRDEGLVAGVALDENGKPEAGMGVDAGDFDGDGDEDLYVTNLAGQTNTLYVNLGGGLFQDGTVAANLGAPSFRHTGFATAWLDYDNDGWLDLLAVNGAVHNLEPLVRRGDPYPLRETKLLLHNRGNRRFEDVTACSGPAMALSEVGRGAAFGDVDNDGDVDVVVANNNGPLRLLLNETGSRRHWLGLRLVGAKVRRDMYGARVAVVRGDGRTIWRRARADGSYLSANDPRVLVGLGDSSGVRSVRVVWPGGGAETWSSLEADRWLTLREGTGKRVE